MISWILKSPKVTSRMERSTKMNFCCPTRVSCDFWPKDGKNRLNAIFRSRWVRRRRAGCWEANRESQITDTRAWVFRGNPWGARVHRRGFGHRSGRASGAREEASPERGGGGYSSSQCQWTECECRPSTARSSPHDSPPAVPTEISTSMAQRRTASMEPHTSRCTASTDAISARPQHGSKAANDGSWWARSSASHAAIRPAASPALQLQQQLYAISSASQTASHVKAEILLPQSRPTNGRSINARLSAFKPNERWTTAAWTAKKSSHKSKLQRRRRSSQKWVSVVSHHR